MITVWHMAATQLWFAGQTLSQPPQLLSSLTGFTHLQGGEQVMSPMGQVRLQPPSGIPLSGMPLSGIPLSGIPLSGMPLSGIPLSPASWCPPSPPSFRPPSVGSQTEIPSPIITQVVPSGQTLGSESQRFKGVRPQASKPPVARRRTQA
jgi:hypothetical protein